MSLIWCVWQCSVYVIYCIVVFACAGVWRKSKPQRACYHTNIHFALDKSIITLYFWLLWLSPKISFTDFSAGRTMQVSVPACLEPRGGVSHFHPLRGCRILNFPYVTSCYPILTASAPVQILTMIFLICLKVMLNLQIHQALMFDLLARPANLRFSTLYFLWSPSKSWRALCI